MGLTIYKKESEVDMPLRESICEPFNDPIKNKIRLELP
jgi:hypothetical protein